MSVNMLIARLQEIAQAGGKAKEVRVLIATSETTMQSLPILNIIEYNNKVNLMI